MGDHVAWDTLQGETTGTIVECHATDFRFDGQHFRASVDDPAFIVESDGTGTRAAHKEGSLTRR